MEAVKQNWAWTWSTSPDDAYEEAIQLLESWSRRWPQPLFSLSQAGPQMFLETNDVALYHCQHYGNPWLRYRLQSYFADWMLIYLECVNMYMIRVDPLCVLLPYFLTFISPIRPLGKIGYGSQDWDGWSVTALNEGEFGKHRIFRSHYLWFNQPCVSLCVSVLIDFHVGRFIQPSHSLLLSMFVWHW
jgi:hypothetical protein